MGRSHAQLGLSLFGIPRLVDDNVPVEIGRRKTLALLAYLAVSRNRESRERIVSLFWPDHAHHAALANLRKAIHELKTISVQLVDTDRRDTLVVNREHISIDVLEFEACVDRYRSSVRDRNLRSRSPDDRQLLETLLECRRIQAGRFMDGFQLPACEEYEEWLFFRREYYTQERCYVLEQTISLYEQLHRFQDAIPPARELVETVPLNEDAHRTLIRLLAEAGQHAAAQRQYDACVELLRYEIGTAPQKQTIDLIERIRNGRIGCGDTTFSPPHRSTGVERAQNRIKAEELCGLAAYSLRISVYHSGHIETARKHYLEAIDIDPECADAYAGLAFTYFSVGGYGVDARFEERLSVDIDRLVQRALAVEPHNAVALLVNAGKRFEWDWEFDEAASLFAEALRIHPSHADMLIWYGDLLSTQIRFDEAYAVLTKAFQLNPTDIASRSRLATYYFDVGDYERCRAVLTETIRLYPNRYLLQRRRALIDSLEGNHASAIEAIEDIVNRDSNNVTRADRVVIYAQAGHIDRAADLCRDLVEHHECGVDGSMIALACHAVGRDEQCLEWLDKAIDQRHTTCLSVNRDAGFGQLHFDPAFQRRVHRIGTPLCPQHIARVLAIRAALIR
jgi:DNA-binding SARP family transcriptional activator/Flp pilus assembly protein TadD